MKIVQDLKSLVGKTVVFTKKTTIGIMPVNAGTKVKIDKIVPTNLGWHFGLDFSTYSKENHELNEGYGCPPEDFKDFPILTFICNMNDHRGIPLEIED